MGTIGACIWAGDLQNIRSQTLLENSLLYLGISSLPERFPYILASASLAENQLNIPPIALARDYLEHRDNVSWQWIRGNQILHAPNENSKLQYYVGEPQTERYSAYEEWKRHDTRCTLRRKNTTTSYILAQRNVCDRTKVHMWGEVYLVTCWTMLLVRTWGLKKWVRKTNTRNTRTWTITLMQCGRLWMIYTHCAVWARTHPTSLLPLIVPPKTHKYRTIKSSVVDHSRL